MRASTTAGINNSLLPRNRICEGFPDGHLLVVPSGKRLLSGVCEEFAVSVSAVVLYEEVSFWRLLDFR